jgi:hypothetical protein
MSHDPSTAPDTPSTMASATDRPASRASSAPAAHTHTASSVDSAGPPFQRTMAASRPHAALLRPSSSRHGRNATTPSLSGAQGTGARTRTQGRRQWEVSRFTPRAVSRLRVG